MELDEKWREICPLVQKLVPGDGPDQDPHGGKTSENHRKQQNGVYEYHQLWQPQTQSPRCCRLIVNPQCNQHAAVLWPLQYAAVYKSQRSADSCVVGSGVSARYKRRKATMTRGRREGGRRLREEGWNSRHEGRWRGAKWWQIWIRSQKEATQFFRSKRMRSVTEDESRITEGLVSSVCRGDAGTGGMFVLLNDHTICLLFTQTVPGSFWGEPLCSWEVRNDPPLVVITSFFSSPSQSESFRRDILSEARQTHSVAHLQRGI